MSKLLAVISVQGRDQKGVVAQFATFVAERGINIEDMEQRVVSGLFVMDMLVDLKDSDHMAATTSLVPRLSTTRLATLRQMPEISRSSERTPASRV